MSRRRAAPDKSRQPSFRPRETFRCATSIATTALSLRTATYGGGKALRIFPVGEAIQALSWSQTSVAEAIGIALKSRSGSPASDMHCAATPAGIAEYPQITFNLGWAAGCLFRIVRELDGRLSVDRRHFADKRDRVEIAR